MFENIINDIETDEVCFCYEEGYLRGDICSQMGMLVLAACGHALGWLIKSKRLQTIHWQQSEGIRPPFNRVDSAY